MKQAPPGALPAVRRWLEACSKALLVLCLTGGVHTYAQENRTGFTPSNTAKSSGTNAVSPGLSWPSTSTPTTSSTSGEASSSRVVRAIPDTDDVPQRPSRSSASDSKPQGPIRQVVGTSDEATEMDLQEPLFDVRVEGNVTITAHEISKYIKSRPGRAVSAKLIKDDVEALVKTRWFATVEPVLRATSEGNVLVFRVLERPIVRHVEYHGNNKIKSDKLAAITQLKAGSPYDVSANKECARRLESHYHQKGYPFAIVELEKGIKREEREVLFRIKEGPKVAVSKIAFEGNEFFSDPLLRLKAKTKTQILWLFGGKYDPSSIPDDIAAVKQYYQSLGFFDVKIEHKVDFGKTADGKPIQNDGTDGSKILGRQKSNATIIYHIEEGPRYSIRNIEISGNQVFSEAQIRELIKFKAGEFFSGREINEDVERIRAKYGEQGRLFSRVDAVPKFLQEPGKLDLHIQIQEDKVYVLREFRVHVLGDYPHTRLNLVRNIARIQPGDLADPKKLKLTESRLGGSQVFEGGPQNGPRLELAKVDGQKWVHPLADADDEAEAKVVRGQTSDMRRPGNNMYENTNPGDPYTKPKYGPTNDPADVLNAPPEYVDIDAYLTEARTGRLMFGVGVNSNSGLVGNAVISEQNFDLFNPPTSISDIVNGTAWRGAGQKFRIEAQPGTQVSRYLIDWSDPYFMDTDYNFGVSGFFYNRYLQYWTEQRAGGRIRVGKQFTQRTSGSIALRLEDVQISNPANPRPQILSESVGDNFLSTVRFGLSHDTRDAGFLPSAGHFLEASYEQAFGNYYYPRFELDAQKYFTTYRRPDGFGKHIVSAIGQATWTGNDTPIFERLYAGGFQSFRGFRFRGVSPVDTGVSIGGQFMLLGTLEYMFPVMASETIRLVTFTDFGTVDNTVSLDKFRVSVGGGVRLTIPAMGPVPIAFDWAVPVVKQDTDHQQVFSFYVGVTR